MLFWKLHGKRPKRYRPKRYIFPLRIEKDHAAVTVEHKVYTFGYGGSLFSSRMAVHVFNTVSLRWVKLSPAETTGGGHGPHQVPSMRFGHTAVLIGDNVVYIWGGGLRHGPLPTYAFDVDTHRWSELQTTGRAPEERMGHSACVLGKSMYIYGGYTNPELLHYYTNYTYHDMYKMDTTTMVWSIINTGGTPPPVSALHSATIIGTKMFVFGGMMGCGFYDGTIRVFDTETDCWLSTLPSAQLLPKGRSDHSSFTYNGELYIFGGEDWNQNFSDLWKFNPETLSWKKVEAKGNVPRSETHLSCCRVGDLLFLFGGYNTSYLPSHGQYILDLSPSLKTLCKLAVTKYGLKQSGLPHNIRWELAAMQKSRLF